jgi:hypothetical protein
MTYKQTLTEKLAENERRAGNAATWIPIVNAAGYGVGSEMTPEEAILLGGDIARDKEVAALSRTPQFEIYDVPAFPGVHFHDYVGVLESMTEEQRAALRARLNHKSLLVTPGPYTR